MKLRPLFLIILVLFIGSACTKEYSPASVDKIRLVWNDNPETTMTIGWDQNEGKDPMLYYGTKDRGRNWNKYKYSKGISKEVSHLGMNTRFCELKDLLPNTEYYFVIQDSEGVSERFWFRTAPDTPTPFTCIVGGDTKCLGEAHIAGTFSNQIVSKLRPLFVMFNGDYTHNGITAEHWELWLTDWFEQTRTEDGRLFPIVPVMGNHENRDLEVLTKVFNTPYQFENPHNIYYSLSLGGDLFHMIATNSEIELAGEQTLWLEADLKKSKDFTFTLAACHKPFSPHTQGKSERISEYREWSYMFYEYGLDIFLDADSHMSKITFPIKPDSINGFEGFVRDDLNGTMYIGEGSWGASPRPANDDKPWTLRSGSFNQLKWLQVFPETETEQAHIDIRTVITSTRNSENQAVSHVDGVSALSEEDVFAIPEGIDLFTTEPYGAMISYPFNIQ